MLIRFFRVSMYPTMAAGRATPTQGNQIMCFVQAGIGVASKPPVVNTVGLVANRFPAADAPIVVAF